MPGLANLAVTIVYFRPVEDRVLFAVYGPRANQQLESAIRERSMEILSQRPEGGAADATMRMVAAWNPGSEI